MAPMASQITSLTVVYSIVYSDADQRKHQSPASLAFVWGIHRGPVNSPHKWPVTRKMFPFDDVIMNCLDLSGLIISTIKQTWKWLHTDGTVWASEAQLVFKMKVLTQHRDKHCQLCFSCWTACYETDSSIETVPVTGIVWIIVSGSFAWWRHRIETFSALLAIWAENSSVTGEFPTQRLVTRSIDVFFDLRLNEGLSKQSCGWWFETSSRPLWRHCNMVKYVSPVRTLPGLILYYVPTINGKSKMV